MIKRFVMNKNNIKNKKNIKKTLSNRRQLFYFKKRIFIPRWAKNGQLDTWKNMFTGKLLTFSISCWNLVMIEVSHSVLRIFICFWRYLEKNVKQFLEQFHSTKRSNCIVEGCQKPTYSPNGKTKTYNKFLKVFPA